MRFFNILIPKSHPKPINFIFFTSKYTSYQNGRYFFKISISKNYPRSISFDPFCFQIWFPHMLRAPMACNFSYLIWSATSAPAALASLLFDPPEPQNVGNPNISRFPFLFRKLHHFSSDFFHL